MDEFSVVLFFSNNYVAWAANALKTEGLYQRVISTPRTLSSGCGYSLKIKTAEEEKARELITAKGIEILGIYKL
jgi:hypothetical protein